MINQAGEVELLKAEKYKRDVTPRSDEVIVLYSRGATIINGLL